MINIIQITDNTDNNDDNSFQFSVSSPQIWGNNVVWFGHGVSDSEIYLYDGTNTIQLTDNNDDDSFPQLWVSSPEIWGNNVVWSSSGVYTSDAEIFFYDGTNTIQLTDNNYYESNPKIWGNNVVWSGSNGIDPEIYFYNGSTTVQLTDNYYYESNLEIWGNNVVWSSSDGNDSEIYFYNGSTTVQLTDNNYHDSNPQIWGNNVVWSSSDGNDAEIFLYDGTNIIQLTDNNYSDIDPEIWGNNIVWLGSDGRDSEIYFYNGSTTVQLTDNKFSDGFPQIWGNNVVWVGSDVNYSEIFLATLPSEISGSTPIIYSPSIFINDVSLLEGDEDNTYFTFTISIAQASNEIITVDYATSDNTSFAGEDYIATNGTLEFELGTTEKTITVEAIGDTEVEETEFFTVDLSNATNAVIVDSQGKAVLENDDILPIDLYRFRNTNYATGGYLFVGEEEKDAIIANPDFNQTFALDGVAEDGAVNPAFVASVTPDDDLLPFYQLQNLDQSGTYLFVSTEEYNAIFAENSLQRDKWVPEGLDAEGIDIPEFYLYGVGAGQGIEFHRFQDINNHSYLFAGPLETEAIYNDPLLSANFVDEGAAFKSLI